MSQQSPAEYNDGFDRGYDHGYISGYAEGRHEMLMELSKMKNNHSWYSEDSGDYRIYTCEKCGRKEQVSDNHGLGFGAPDDDECPTKTEKV